MQPRPRLTTGRPLGPFWATCRCQLMEWSAAVDRYNGGQGGVSMNLHTIGIDLGKTVFHLVGLSQAGEVEVRKRFSRAQLLRFTANVQVDLIGMEACAGSHFLGRAPTRARTRSAP